MTTELLESTEALPAIPVAKPAILFSVTEATIAKMGEYLTLRINGIDDKEGLAKVHAARMECVKARSANEKARKEQKAWSLEYGRKVDGEAKRLEALIEPIETHLRNQELAVEKEQERIAKEKRDALVKGRLAKLDAVGQHFFPADLVGAWDEPTFTEKLRWHSESVASKKAAEERQRKEDEERKERQRLENERLEAERKRLDEENRRQKAEQDRLDAARKKQEAEAQAERDRLAAEQRRIDEEKARLEKQRLDAIVETRRTKITGAGIHVSQIPLDGTLRTATDSQFDSLLASLIRARDDAAEQARKDAEAKAQREREEAAEREREAEAARLRAEAIKPDKQKICDVAAKLLLLAMDVPEFSESLTGVRSRIIACIEEAAHGIDRIANELK